MKNMKLIMLSVLVATCTCVTQVSAVRYAVPQTTVDQRNQDAIRAFLKSNYETKIFKGGSLTFDGYIQSLRDQQRDYPKGFDRRIDSYAKQTGQSKDDIIKAINTMPLETSTQ